MSAVKLPVRFSALNRSAVQSVGLRRGSAGGKSCFGRGGRGVLGQERGAESGEVCVGGGGGGGPGSEASGLRQGAHTRNQEGDIARQPLYVMMV